MKLQLLSAPKLLSLLYNLLNKTEVVRKLLLIATTIMCFSFAHAQTLIAYYPLNGNAKDVSGNHFDGVISGGITSVNDRNGNASSALKFNGNDGRIDVRDNPALRPVDFSVSAWFYLPKFSTEYKNIVTKNLCNATHESFALQINPYTRHIEGTVCDGSRSIAVIGPTPSLGIWHLATMTFDQTNNSLKLYFDGSLADFLKTPLKIEYDNSSFSIGDELENCTHDYFFNGKIDDLRLFNGILSNKQVSQLFDSTMHRAGSGTALQCDGNTNYIAMPQKAIAWDRTFTIEYWIKTTESRSSGTYYQRPTMIGNETYYGSSGDFGITTDNGKIGMWSGLNSAGDNVFLTNTKINNNRWHHIAAVNNGVDVVLYVDGVLQQGSLQSGQFLKTSTHPFYIGASNSYAAGGAGFYHQGQYDEVRFWDKALSRQQIRNRMCHKITPSDSLYSHLVAYYNFDEANKTTAFDIANYNNALLINDPQRAESIAPIGDTSANNYFGDAKTVSITAASGETFTINSTAGKTSGLQLYVVNESPRYLNGVDTLCNKNKYFGVFLAKDKQATFSAVYNYTTNPCVNASDEKALRVYQKPTPDSNDWYQLPNVPNTNSNTISINNIESYNAKFILGLDTASTFAANTTTNYVVTGKDVLSVLVSPNPASSQLHVHFNNASKEYANTLIILKNTDGKQVWSNTGNKAIQQDVIVNISMLPPGAYFLQVFSKDETVTKKIIIER